MFRPARHFEVTQEIALPRALPRALVWQALAHTERFNRAIGLSSVEYGAPRHENGELFRIARSRIAGIPLAWREFPFQWEIEGRYSVVRLYEKGPLARFEGGAELEALGLNRILVRFFSDLTPANACGKAIMPLLANGFLKKALAFCDEHLQCAKSMARFFA